MNKVEWKRRALHMIEKTDGSKYPQMAVVDAVSQLIDESICAFAHRHGIYQANSDPDEGIAYAKLRLVKALERVSVPGRSPGGKD